MGAFFYRCLIVGETLLVNYSRRIMFEKPGSTLCSEIGCKSLWFCFLLFRFVHVGLDMAPEFGKGKSHAVTEVHNNLIL